MALCLFRFRFFDSYYFNEHSIHIRLRRYSWQFDVDGNYKFFIDCNIRYFFTFKMAVCFWIGCFYIFNILACYRTYWNSLIFKEFINESHLIAND